MYREGLLLLCLVALSTFDRLKKEDISPELEKALNAFMNSPYCDSECACFCSRKMPQDCYVDCTNVDMRDSLYHAGYFADNNNDESYLFNKLILRGTNWPEIKIPFVRTHIETLDLGNNSIKKLGNEIFKNQIALNNLYLDHNEIEYLNPGTFRVCSCCFASSIVF